MKNSNDTIGNRTRDLPTCSGVPQPTALPCGPLDVNDKTKFDAYNELGRKSGTYGEKGKLHTGLWR